jgi:hypothetical protein
MYTVRVERWVDHLISSIMRQVHQMMLSLRHASRVTSSVEMHEDTPPNIWIAHENVTQHCVL